MAFIGSTFYCRDCADSLGLLRDMHPTTSAPSTYQYDKALKHTRPSVLSSGEHSVLNSRSTTEYQSLEQQAYECGFVEVEVSGTRTLILQTTGSIGTLYRGGMPVHSADSYRRVLSTDCVKAHGYPQSSTNYAGIQCADCSILLTS